MIRADLNHMPEIPDNTFHYAFSFNCLTYTEPDKSFREIYRILRPGGFADLDLEFWVEQYLDQVAALPFVKNMLVSDPFRGWQMPLEEGLKATQKAKQAGVNPLLIGIETKFRLFKNV